MKGDGMVTAERDAVSEVSGQVFNIQRFSVHDGPGIRTTVFLKGCPLRCFWCQNPESQRLEPIMMFNQSKCSGCGRCVADCPVQANTIVDGVCEFDRSLCELCGLCVKRCFAKSRSIEGKTMTVSEVMDVVKRDARMFDNSGGGMTISGGDCEMQPEFTIALLKAAHSEHIHTAVEITGVYTWDLVKRVTEHADCLLYDLKCIDDTRHREGTGVSNKNILENARRLVAEGKTIQFRMPLIPGYNDSIESVRAVSDFVKNELGLSAEENLELLAYNNLGEEKYNRIDRADEQPEYQRQSDEYLEELRAVCVA
jgi:pyruvate formate lyase activating enzyme